MLTRPLLAVLVIILSILAVYLPSLQHVPRSDQIVYLYEVSQQYDWYSLAIGDWQLNRWGTFAPGDERLFRPGFYFILGSAKFFFQDHWWMWQAFGIFLHISVSLSLFALLWRMRSGLSAFAGALFFALMFLNMEMVIFSHLNPYMVFMILVLWALYHLHQLLIPVFYQWWRFPLMVTLLTIASMVYEMGSLIMMLLTAILLIVRPKQWLRWMTLGVLAMMIIGVETSLGQAVNKLPWINVQPIGWWLWGGLFIDQLSLMFSGRNMIVGNWQPSWQPFQSYWMLSLSIAVLGCVTLRNMIKVLLKGFYPTVKHFIGISTFFILILYASLVAWGRGGFFSLNEILTQNLHYFYFAWILIIVTTFAFLNHPIVTNRLYKTMLVIAFLTLVVFNGYKLVTTIEFQAKASETTHQLLDALQGLIKEHGKEPDFSFKVPVDFPGNYPYENKWMKATFVDMLYPQWTSHQKPKYQLVIDAKTQ